MHACACVCVWNYACYNILHIDNNQAAFNAGVPYYLSNLFRKGFAYMGTPLQYIVG
jgi:hypothetical protein